MTTPQPNRNPGSRQQSSGAAWILAAWLACISAWAQEATAVSGSLGVGSPEAFEEKLAGDPAYARQIPSRIAALFEGSQAEAAFVFFAEAARARSRRIGARGAPWTDRDLNELLSLAFVHPARFFKGDPAFRAQVLAQLPAAIDPAAPRGLRRSLLETVSKIPGLDFEACEKIAVGWALAARSSAERRVDFSGGAWRTVDDGLSPIRATLLSLPSHFFAAADGLALLRSLRTYRPQRRLLVLTDFAGREGAAAAAFRDGARELGVDLLDSFGHEFSPWLRDPLLPLAGAREALLFLTRPNFQEGRVQDQFLARQLIQNLPADFEQDVGPVSWAPAPHGFHGGHLLFTPRAVWISIHTLQDRMLEILGQKTIDVARLHEPAEWRRFASAAEAAKGELARLSDRPLHFVHPWPGEGSAVPPFLEALSGGNDFDLDVLLTFLPSGERPVALIGDLELGAELLTRVEPAELSAFAARFQIGGDPATLRDSLLTYQRGPHARGLTAFLSLTAAHLAGEGLRVLRTPLLLVPSHLISESTIRKKDRPPQHFPLGFSNVVLETTAIESACAESFSAGLPTLDRRTTEIFATAGYRLQLHPPLVESLIYEGGYRCATQEIRRPAATPR